MGWTFMNRPKGYTDRAWIEREFGPEFAKKIVAVSSSRSVIHIVVEVPFAEQSDLLPDEHGNVRYCVLLLTKWIRGDDYNWGYKDMSEFSGPCETKCPTKLLDLLSPIRPSRMEAAYHRRDEQGDNSYSPVLCAWEWRAACHRQAARRKSLTIGQTYKLPYKLSFTYHGEVDTFTLIERKGRRIVFRVPEGGRVRLRQESLGHLSAV